MPPNKTALLIVNPISGDSDKTKLISSLEIAIAERGYELQVYYTTGDGDHEQIAAVIKRKPPGRVLVAGGDGTIQLAAGIMKGTNIPVGILPYGSANGFAVNLGIPTDMEGQLDIALGGTTVDADLLELNGHLCIHIADMGVNAELIKNYDNATIRGKLGYILQSIPSLIKADFPYEFSIKANGKEYVKEGVLLAIANANKFGTGANINPTGKLDDGKFELIIFKSFHLGHIIKTLWGQEELHPDFAETISTSEAMIQCTSPVAFQVDGEFIGETRDVHASIAAGKLKIAVPPDFTGAS